jgi:hypothetical protein
VPQDPILQKTRKGWGTGKRQRFEIRGQKLEERSLAALGMTGLGHNGSGRSCGLDGVHWRRTKKFATGRRFLLTLINAMVYLAT